MYLLGKPLVGHDGSTSLEQVAAVVINRFTAKAIRQWLSGNSVKTVYIKPGAPWENAYAESFISKVRDEILDREIFYTLEEAQGDAGALPDRLQHRAPALGARLPGAPGSDRGGVMDQLPVAIWLLLAGLIDGPASVFVGATGGRNSSFAASSPAEELAAPSHKTMSQPPGTKSGDLPRSHPGRVPRIGEKGLPGAGAIAPHPALRPKTRSGRGQLINDNHSVRFRCLI